MQGVAKHTARGRTRNSGFGQSFHEFKVRWKGVPEFQSLRKLFWEFKRLVLWDSKIVLGIEVAHKFCFGNSGASFCDPRNALLEFKLPWKGVLGNSSGSFYRLGNSFWEFKWPVHRFGKSFGGFKSPVISSRELFLGIQAARSIV